MYANRLGYTDITPYEVVVAKTARKLVIREMKCELDPNWKPEMIPGGFAAHTVNNSTQEWTITSEPGRESVVIRQHKNGEWKDKYGNRYSLNTKPVKFYDYNF